MEDGGEELGGEPEGVYRRLNGGLSHAVFLHKESACILSILQT